MRGGVNDKIGDMKRFLSFVIAISVLFSFAACSEGENDRRTEQTMSEEDEILEEYEPFIRSYLGLKYGEEFSHNVEIEVQNLDERIFELSTPVLASYSSFVVRPMPDGSGVPVVPDHAAVCEFTDNLLETFWLDMDFRADFMSYVHDELQLPDDLQIDNLILDSFDFEGYTYGDDYTSRFATTEYHVIIVDWTCDAFDRDDAEIVMQEFYYDYWPLLIDSLGENGSLIVNCVTDDEVIYHATFYIDDSTWTGPDATLYAYTDDGQEIVDSYYWD